jgi:predicted CXXCH cytochrome family protein
METPSSIWLRLALAVTLAGAVTVACSIEDHYETLSFFFDGVPTPEELEARREAERLAAEMEDQVGRKLSNKERAALLATKIEAIYTSRHKPVEEGNCTECHIMAEGVSSSQSGWMTDLPQLVAPIQELCLRCHDRPQGRFTHGPASAGNCSICHQAHKSLYPSLLRKERQESLCIACHQPEVFLTKDLHEKVQQQECTECHNPHASDHEFLLRPEATDLGFDYRPPVQEAEPGK